MSTFYNFSKSNKNQFFPFFQTPSHPFPSSLHSSFHQPQLNTSNLSSSPLFISPPSSSSSSSSISPQHLSQYQVNNLDILQFLTFSSSSSPILVGSSFPSSSFSSSSHSYSPSLITHFSSPLPNPLLLPSRSWAADEIVLAEGYNTEQQYDIMEAESIHNWLKSINYAHLLPQFINSGYDLPTISKMTPEDLTAIGITQPIIRKKICNEIAKLHLHDNLPTFWPTSFNQWLALIHLHRYHDNLVREGYNSLEEVIQLTWEDLEEIGIKRLGHQKKIILAIERLKRLSTSKTTNKTSRVGGGFEMSEIMRKSKISIPCHNLIAEQIEAKKKILDFKGYEEQEKSRTNKTSNNMNNLKRQNISKSTKNISETSLETKQGTKCPQIIHLQQSIPVPKAEVVPIKVKEDWNRSQKNLNLKYESFHGCPSQDFRHLVGTDQLEKAPLFFRHSYVLPPPPPSPFKHQEDMNSLQASHTLGRVRRASGEVPVAENFKLMKRQNSCQGPICRPFASDEDEVLSIEEAKFNQSIYLSNCSKEIQSNHSIRLNMSTSANNSPCISVKHRFIYPDSQDFSKKKNPPAPPRRSDSIKNNLNLVSEIEEIQSQGESSQFSNLEKSSLPKSAKLPPLAKGFSLRKNSNIKKENDNNNNFHLQQSQQQFSFSEKKFSFNKNPIVISQPPSLPSSPSIAMKQKSIGRNGTSLNATPNKTKPPILPKPKRSISVPAADNNQATSITDVEIKKKDWNENYSHSKDIGGNKEIKSCQMITTDRASVSSLTTNNDNNSNIFASTNSCPVNRSDIHFTSSSYTLVVSRDGGEVKFSPSPPKLSKKPSPKLPKSILPIDKKKNFSQKIHNGQEIILSQKDNNNNNNNNNNMKREVSFKNNKNNDDDIEGDSSGYENNNSEFEKSFNKNKMFSEKLNKDINNPINQTRIMNKKKFKNNSSVEEGEDKVKDKVVRSKNEINCDNNNDLISSCNKNSIDDLDINSENVFDDIDSIFQGLTRELNQLLTG